MSNETSGKRGNKSPNSRRKDGENLDGFVDVETNLAGSPDDRRSSSILGSPDDR